MAKQRQVRIEQGLSPALMEEMQGRTEEQLKAETKYRSIALSILGSRAAERYDAEATRTYFRRALAASRPQERPQIRRMANASLALAEHRAGDLKVEKLGHEAPPKRALMGLRLMGLIAPPKGAPMIRRVRGIAVVLLIVIVLLLLGLGIVELISLPFGGVGTAPGVLLGLILIAVVLSTLAFVGRRRQRKAQAKAKAAKGRPVVAAAKAPAGRRSRGADEQPASPAGQTRKPRGQATTKPVTPGSSAKTGGQAKQSGAAKTGGQTKQGGQSGKTGGQSTRPGGSAGKPGRRTRGSGPAS
jgi:hypothetical protein